MHLSHTLLRWGLLVAAAALPAATAHAQAWTQLTEHQVAAFAADADGRQYIATIRDSAFAPPAGMGTRFFLDIEQRDAAGVAQWRTTSKSREIIANPGPGAPPLGPFVPTFSTPTMLADGRGHLYLAGQCAPGTWFGALPLPPVADTTHIIQYLASVDVATGAWQWVATAEATVPLPFYSPLVTSSLATDAAGTIYVAGTADGPIQFGAITSSILPGEPSGYFVATCSATGQWQWVSRMPGAHGPIYESVSRLATDAAGHVFLSGYVNGFAAANDSSFITDPGVSAPNTSFVARLDAATGAWQWVRQTGEWDNFMIPMWAPPLHIDAHGELRVLGRVRDTTRFDGVSVPGPGPLYNEVGATYFLGRLDARGRWLSAQPLPIPPSLNTGSVGHLIEPSASTFTRRGELLIAGTFNDSTVTIGGQILTNANPATTDVFVTGFDAAGSSLGAVSAGGNDFDLPTDIAEGALGQVYCVGTLESTTTYGPFTVSLPASAAFSNVVARLDGLTSTAPLAAPAALASAAVQLYPNPAHARATLQGAASTRVQLLDALGRTVLDVAAPAGTAALPLAGLPAGLYVVRAGAVSRRLVVE